VNNVPAFAAGPAVSPSSGPPPAVPPALVELLARHDPERAARVRRLSEGPAPGTVLVLGPAEDAVGRLAAALAARLPTLVRCAPATRPVGAGPLADTRAVVWVFDGDAPMSPPLWARLVELAGQVDEVHLAQAGPRGASGVRRALADRLADALPRLAGAPVHPAAGCPVALLAALDRPSGHAGYRNALRVLDTGLLEARARLQTRLRRAERRAALTDRELRRHRDELAIRVSQTREWPRRLRVDLGQVKLTATNELSSAVRQLRDEVRQHLAGAGREDRARFPHRFRAAAERLSDRVGRRFDELFEAVSMLVPPSVLSAAPGSAAAVTPTGSPPSRPLGVPSLMAVPEPPDHRRLEDRLMPLLGASGGLGVGRLALTAASPGPTASSTWSHAALPVAVGLGVGVGWWLARARRAAGERARLGRWAGEMLGELRLGWEAVLAERLLDAERRLTPPLDREVADRASQLADELREHDLLTRRVSARRSGHADADGAAVAELAAAHDKLVELLASGAPTQRSAQGPAQRPTQRLPELAG
jgi:hypothetical protein